jgi:FKBP12-rapamycin complex-associated protein
MPSLRKTLIQLLTELEYSGDSRGREQSSQLLCHLIRASKRLVKPYATPILKVLRPRLRDSHPGVATSV